jgi:hypothetical protein
MNDALTDEVVKTFSLEKWVEIFGGIYQDADKERSASSLWFDVMEESNELAEFVRRDEYDKAIDIMPDILGRLFRFMAKYSENVTEQVIDTEGIDLRSKNRDGLFVTEWVLRQYPGLCSVCAQKPCQCLSSRAEQDKRNGNGSLTEGQIRRLQEKNRAFNDNISQEIQTYNVDKLCDLFNEVYRGAQDDRPVSSLSARFFEDVGEVSKALLSFGNIQIVKESRSSVNYLKYLRYLHVNLKEKISDVISRSMELVNKINAILRSTDQSSDADTQQNPARPITISQLLFQKFYHEETNSFVCSHCHADKCTPACNEIRLILEIDRKVDEHGKKLSEIRQVLGPSIDNRIGDREAINLETELDDYPIQIVNLGACNTGFLCHMNYPLNDIKTITVKQNNSAERLTCKITRPVIAGQHTGYQFYYGAEILAREKLEPLEA